VFYAGDAGPVEVRSIAQNGHVRVIVADHGPGVPEKDLPHLFTPFYRIDGSRDRRSGGTGLGLAIVRTAVEGSGGSVSCRNREPNGLEVTITLPTAHV
jgi:signal transduction histidine kinase